MPELTPEEQALVQRAQERWDALVAQDYERAWTYLEPAEREKTEQKNYKAHFGDALVWKEAEALNAKCLPARCAVLVRLTSQAMLPGMGTRAQDITTHMTEEWVLEDGTWWYKRLAPPMPAEGEERPPSAALPPDPVTESVEDPLGGAFGPGPR